MIGTSARGAHAREDAAISWLLPTPLLILAGVIGFALALPRVQRSTSNVRPVAEVFSIAVLTCLGFAAAWAAWWWVEQRW